MASWSTLAMGSLPLSSSSPKPPSTQISNSDVAFMSSLLSGLQKEAAQDLSDKPLNRQKLRQNFEFAQLRLLQLERDAAGTSSDSKPTPIPKTLSKFRDVLKQLGIRLLELDQASLSMPKETDQTGLQPDDSNLSVPSIQVSPVPTPTASPGPPDVLRDRSSNILRSRKTAVSSSDQTDRSGGVSSGVDTPNALTNLQSEKLTQQELRNQILDAAKRLRESEELTARLLQRDDENVSGALDVVFKSNTAIETTTRKMGAIARMAEGRGWMGRMWLYGYIAGLWVLALVVVFVLPKLRF